MLAQVSLILSQLGLPKESLDGWECHVAQRNGQDVAMVIVRGCEVHMASLTDKGAISRKNVLQFLTPILDKHGMVTTRTPLSVTDDRLRDKLGFIKTWSDDRWNYFALTELPYQKATK